MKKKGLLVWFEIDKRPELLQPFINMSNEIEFIHLFYRTKADRKAIVSPFEMIYWFDFTGPYDLLEKIKPDFIIGVTEGLMEISLIAAAKESEILYYGLQHGFAPEGLELLLPEINRPSVFTGKTLKKYFKIFKWYFSSLRLKNSRRIRERMHFFISFYKMNPVDAIMKTGYSWLKPDHYICFSEQSAGHYRNLYGLTKDELIYIGIPSFDELFQVVKKGNSINDKGNYYLLIDTNFEEYHTSVSGEKIWRCYNELAKYCRQQNAGLIIKLHPWSYKYDYVDNETISFVKNVSMQGLGTLISNAVACFGFYSTLTIPIAFIKPTIQIKYDDVFEPELVKEDITPVVDFFTFTSENIKFNEDNLFNEAMIRRFLFSTDGNASERLRDILLRSPGAVNAKTL